MSNKLQASRLQKKNHSSVEWAVSCEQGTKIEDLLSPQFYANIANRVNKNDTIRVIFEDGSYIVDLLITEIDSHNVTPVWAKVIIINLIDIEKAKKFSTEIKQVEKKKVEKVQSENEEEFNHPDFIIKFRGPHLKYSVLTKSDNSVLRERLENKSEAIKAAKEIIAQLNDNN